MKTVFKILALVLIFWSTCSCKQDSALPKYQTRNVVIVIIDGARYSETWGDATHQYIPKIAGIAKTGTVYTRFYNNGPTYTSAGHTAITTGYYQEIDNTGKEFPKYPSIFQYYNQTYPTGQYNTWIIASKDKLDILANCTDSNWRGKFLPNADCGKDGKGTGSGYRSDTLTCEAAIEIMKKYHPALVLINLKDPDETGHEGIWEKYLDAIKSADALTYKIWEFITTDSNYAGKTTFIITNDHGRHLDEVADGFISHGDDCEGCRHLQFFISGPDIRSGVITDVQRELIDIPVTLAELLQIKIDNRGGKIMKEAFVDK